MPSTQPLTILPRLTPHCPKCQELNLGPLVLYCGHLKCRKCVREEVEPEKLRGGRCANIVCDDPRCNQTQVGLIALLFKNSLTLHSPLLCRVNYVCGRFSTPFYHIFVE